MALSMKQVPWLSPAEWYDTYRQIYSNDTIEQVKAYEVLLAWKARMPKLPVGVECTLSILQVCLRDREWIPKIDSGELPMYYENDLSLMYSTTIMRFLNHISNIGHTKEASLFMIAKQLKIPEWIVNLRHQAAHGHELPSVGVLRIAVNVLLEWLHDEYWAVEARIMEEYYTKDNIEKQISLEEEEEFEQIQTFTDLIEVWSAVALYIDAGHDLVSNLPDEELREILQDLRTNMLFQYNNKNNDENEYIIISKKTVKLLEKEYNLKAAKTLLLFGISEHLTGNESSNIAIHKKTDMICNILCKNTTFLPNSDIINIFRQEEGIEKKNNSLKGKILPFRMLQFWKDIIFLLHRKAMLETLMFKLFDIINQERESKERRTFAALWISSIVYSFVQLDIAQNISHNAEQTLKKLDTKTISQYVREHIRCNYPYLHNVLWLDISSIMPHFLTDINFATKLLLRGNEFSKILIEPILKLVIPKIDTQAKKHLLKLLKYHKSVHIPKYNNKDNSHITNNDVHDKIYTIEDLQTKNVSTENEEQLQMRKNINNKKENYLLADQTIRNLHWKPALDIHQFESPIGLLPWQMDSLESLKSLKVNIPKHSVSVLDSQITAGIINCKNLRMQSCIKWNDVLRRKRKITKKRVKVVHKLY